MTRVLVVWEDALCKALDTITQRCVRAAALDGTSTTPTLVRHSARGNGAFARYVRTTWPLARAKGVPLDPKPIDHMFCVVDADRLHELRLGIEKAPTDPGQVAAWHATAEAAWQTWLRTHVDPAGPSPTTVHGIVLRWAKESVLLAGFDQPATARWIDVDSSHADVKAAINERCDPHPDKVADEAFTNVFRKPLGCIDAMRRARALPPLDKSDPAVDDAIQALAKESLPVILRRVPDIARLTDRVWALHRGDREPPPPAEPRPKATKAVAPPAKASRSTRPKKRSRK